MLTLLGILMIIAGFVVMFMPIFSSNPFRYADTAERWIVGGVLLMFTGLFVMVASVG